MNLSVHDHALIIPAYGEPVENIRQALSPLSRRVLPIIVVNRNHRITEERLAANNALLDYLGGVADAQAIGNADGREVVVVDINLPSSKGAGGARRLGAEIALSLQRRNVVRCRWLHFVDADSTLPDEHFSQVERLPDEAVAAVRVSKRVSEEDRIIEMGVGMASSLIGMGWAGSPWAFPTTGTAVSVRTRAYEAVGGYPARPTAEDTSLLLRVADVGPIGLLWSPAATTQARSVSRTLDAVTGAPLGYGEKIKRLLRDDAKVVTTDPEVWPMVKAAYGALNRYAVEALDPIDICREECARCGVDDWRAVNTCVEECYGPWQVQPRYEDRRGPLFALHSVLNLMGAWRLVTWLGENVKLNIPIAEAMRRTLWIRMRDDETLREVYDRLFKIGDDMSPKLVGPYTMINADDESIIPGGIKSPALAREDESALPDGIMMMADG